MIIYLLNNVLKNIKSQEARAQQTFEHTQQVVRDYPECWCWLQDIFVYDNLFTYALKK